MPGLTRSALNSVVMNEQGGENLTQRGLHSFLAPTGNFIREGGLLETGVLIREDLRYSYGANNKVEPLLRDFSII